MNNCTLIVDGNWLLMSSLYSSSYDFHPESLDMMKQVSRDTLIDSMCSSINVALNTFDGIVDNVIYVSDGGSWRKFIGTPKLMEEGEYKGTRKRAEDIDWDYVFETHEILQKGLTEAGITVCHEGKIEGDDWIWHWTRKLNKQGTNCIIWSTDNDLKQLVNLQNGFYTAWYNSRNGIFFHKDLDPSSIDDIDYFMTAGRDNYIVESLEQVIKQVSFIDPINIIKEKIICGDKSDNIRSLIVLNKNGKNYRITEKDAADVISQYNTLDSFFEHKTDIIKQIKGLKKFVNSTEDIDNMDELFDYNKRLVWLNESQIPKDLQEKMNTLEYKVINITDIKHNYKMLLPSYLQGDAQKVFESLNEETDEGDFNWLNTNDLEKMGDLPF